MRIFAHEAGALLLICAGAAAAIVCVALVANTHAPGSFPDTAPLLKIVAALGILQIACSLLMWRIFLVMRRSFARRLQAATGSLDDRVFLSDASGKRVSVLTESGWTQTAAGDWLSTIHLDDRDRWPVRDATGPQRVELRLRDRDDNWRWHLLSAMPLHNSKGALLEWVGTLHDIHEQKVASEHRDLVIGELRHRLKNLLTVIDALAKNSRRPAAAEPGVESFLQRFLGRLHALGTAGDLVLAGDRVAIEMGALIEATLTPFIGDNARRIHIAGPPLRLTEEIGAGLGLAVHELATNALKYGALSVPEGTVSFTWSVTQAGEDQEIAFVWKEHGGPPPALSTTPGFGTRMIKSVVSREKDGHVDIEYRPDGFYCRIAFVKTKSDPQRVPTE